MKPTERKFTDEEIEKALECCSSYDCDLKAYGKRYCNSISRCSRCKIYQMLESKYPQGEGG